MNELETKFTTELQPLRRRALAVGALALGLCLIGYFYRSRAIFSLLSDRLYVLAGHPVGLSWHRDDPPPGRRNLGVCDPAFARVGDPNLSDHGRVVSPTVVVRATGFIYLGAPASCRPGSGAAAKSRLSQYSGFYHPRGGVFRECGAPSGFF